MDASWVPSVVIGGLSLATGIAALLKTRLESGTPHDPAKTPPPAPVNKPAVIAAPREQDSMAHVLQRAIDRIERLEEENTHMALSLAKTRTQLRDCIALRRQYEHLIGRRFKQTSGGSPNDS